MSDDKLDPDFAALSPQDRAGIEALSGIGLHHAPDDGAADESATGDAFHHPEEDDAGTVWEPNWEPIETYTDSDVVMLDDGHHQILGMRKMGMWTELLDGDEVPKPDYLPMLWSTVPEPIMYEMMYR